MNFAKKVLENLGWKEGEGLGRNGDGIAKPLKASMKFDKAGLGSNVAEEDFNNHWWQRIFDEAAGNLQVASGKDEGGIRMGLKNTEDLLEISTKGYSMRKLEKLRRERQQQQDKEAVVNYGNFVPASRKQEQDRDQEAESMKEEEAEGNNKETEEDISVSTVKVLSDEELFAACGGRTAHKGARHGLYLNGKLSRLEQQEADLLQQLQMKNSKIQNTMSESSVKSGTKDKDSTSKEFKTTKSNKKKEKKERETDSENTSRTNLPEADDNSETSMRRKKKKKKKEESTKEEEVEETKEIPPEEKRKHSTKEEEDEEMKEIPPEEQIIDIRRKKEKKRRKMEEETHISMDHSSKKKKKKRHKHQESY